MSRKLIKLSSNLAEYIRETVDIETATKAEPYVKALSQFDQVVEACFGAELKSNFSSLIKDFMKTYHSLNISIPLKVHLLEGHIEEFLTRKGGNHGAGYWSEQAMEACHYDLNNE